MTLKLEVGKTYLTRSGVKVEIINDTRLPPYKFASITGATYLENGRSNIDFESTSDLVSEWKDPNIIPEKESKVKQVYMTTDGTSFGTSEEAEDHQGFIDAMDEINSIIEEYPGTIQFDELDVAEFIIDNRVKILEVLKTITKE